MIAVRTVLIFVLILSVGLPWDVPANGGDATSAGPGDISRSLELDGMGHVRGEVQASAEATDRLHKVSESGGAQQPLQRITIAMLAENPGDSGSGSTRHAESTANSSDSLVLRVPEAVVALIFGILGFLVVGRRDYS